MVLAGGKQTRAGTHKRGAPRWTKVPLKKRGPAVVNVRKAALRKQGYDSLQAWLADPGHEYVGRNMVFFVGAGAEASEWRNPFPVKKHGLQRSLELYRTHLEAMLQDPDTRRRFEGLRGKQLGCWCHPEPCHADVLLSVLSSPGSGSGS